MRTEAPVTSTSPTSTPDLPTEMPESKDGNPGDGVTPTDLPTEMPESKDGNPGDGVTPTDLPTEMPESKDGNPGDGVTPTDLPTEMPESKDGNSGDGGASTATAQTSEPPTATEVSESKDGNYGGALPGVHDDGKEKAKTAITRRFVDAKAANLPDTLKPAGVTKEMLSTFFDPEVCKSSEKDRAVVFQGAADRSLQATEIVLRPSTSTAKKAEEMAKQADIRNSFLMSSQKPEMATGAAEADPVGTVGATSTTTTLEEELEKMMDAEAAEEEMAGVSADVPPAPSGRAKAGSTPKSKPKAHAKQRSEPKASKSSKVEVKAKASSSRSNNFNGPAKTPSRGNNFKKNK